MNKHYIWIYFILFYALWSFRELWLVDYMDLIDPIALAIISAIMKIVIWVIPVLLLVTFFDKSHPFTYLGLNHSIRTGLKWSAWVSVVLIIYFVMLNFTVLNNHISFAIEFHELLNTVLLVGITEEIVFRGFILRKLLNSFRFWIANVITALLFVSIHFPIWFYKGLFEFPAIFSSIITAFVMGILFGYVYKKSNSLWSVIIIHSFYNLLVSVYY